jgi:hypothetical protein
VDGAGWEDGGLRHRNPRAINEALDFVAAGRTLAGADHESERGEPEGEAEDDADEGVALDVSTSSRKSDTGRFGVMIAHGDLAVECGFERMAEVQEEILWICEAAHTPVIWATQVLESLAKTGMPSRAEVTDAAMSERAECVMLNKGRSPTAFIVSSRRRVRRVLHDRSGAA